MIEFRSSCFGYNRRLLQVDCWNVVYFGRDHGLANWSLPTPTLCSERYTVCHGAADGTVDYRLCPVRAYDVENCPIRHDGPPW